MTSLVYSTKMSSLLAAVIYWCVQLLAIQSVYSTTLYVTTHINGTDCPPTDDIQCHTLSYYISDDQLMNIYFVSDTVVIFLEGTHTLNSLVILDNVTNITLQGVDKSLVNIMCINTTNGGGFRFSNTTVSISYLTFFDCGAPLDRDLLNSYFRPYLNGLYSTFYNFEMYSELLYGTLAFIGSKYVSLDNVNIYSCTSYCIFALNTESFDVTQVDISHSNLTEYKLKCCHGDTSLSCIGGNIITFYLDKDNCDTNANLTYNLSIYSTVLSHAAGYYTVNGSLIMSGLTIVDLSVHNLMIRLDSVLLFENNGGNLASLTTYATFEIYNVSSVGANRFICANVLPMLSFKISVTNEIECAGIDKDNNIITFVNIYHSNFSSNLATDSAGINIDSSLIVRLLPIRSMFHVNVTDSTFSDNAAAFGSCVGIGSTTPVIAIHLMFNMINVSLINNHYDHTYLSYDPTQLRNPYRGVVPSCIAYGNTAVASLYNVTIANHDMLGIYSYNTFMFLYGSNVLRNNTGTLGGGLMLLGHSAFKLLSSNLSFIDNKAMRGAGIYVDLPLVSSVESPFCPYQVSGDINDTDSVMYFYGNKAYVTGDVIYGAFVDSCYFVTRANVVAAVNYFYDVFDIVTDDTPSNGSLISSDAIKLCYCFHGQPFCETEQLLTPPIFPGQNRTVSVATIGEHNGTTTGTFVISSSIEDIFEGTQFHINEARCTNVSLPVHANISYIGSNYTLFMLIYDSYDKLSNRQLQLILPIKQCPPGFNVSRSSFSCSCDSFLEREFSDNIKCSIDNQSIILINEDSWIGFCGNNTVLASKDCPFDYCSSNVMSFNVEDINQQCALNRSGTLCGQCSDGLSLMLGSNRCGLCNDNGVALLLVFAAAGLFLVVLLIVLNLTVTVGTINGLILYVNLINVGQSIFFPGGPIPVLSQFIAWFNLDFGIETCFFNGLNSYIKTWLQFVFPLYIWIIILSIIVACRYSTTLSRLVGYNAVPVLATLLLLSYVKLIRTFVLSLMLSYVTDNNGVTYTVWSVDGNISYTGVRHIFLFLFALSVLVFMLLPYALFVLSIPILERYSGKCTRIWLNFAKPVSDAYSGPFKDKFRFWTGLLLFSRLIIAFVIPFLSPKQHIIFIIFVCFILIIVFAHTGGPNKAWYNNILDLWFMLNIQAISVLALFDQAVIGTKISVSLAIVTFFIIVTVHLIVRCKGLGICDFKSKAEDSSTVDSPNTVIDSVPAVVIDDNNKLRESLLESYFID